MNLPNWTDKEKKNIKLECKELMELRCDPDNEQGSIVVGGGILTSGRDRADDSPSFGA